MDIIATNNATGIAMRWHDNSDGTYSPVLSTGSFTATREGISLNGSVGALSAPIVPAGTFDGDITIQNTHATQTLSISFNNPALSTDFKIQPGAALTLHFGPTNTLYGIGGGAATTFAAIGA